MTNIVDQSHPVTESIRFHCEAPTATLVSLVGDFNNWNPSAHPMERQTDGSWRVEVLLSCKRHYYQFLVDGEPILDPEAMCSICRQRNSRVSLIALC